MAYISTSLLPALCYDWMTDTNTCCDCPYPSFYTTSKSDVRKKCGFYIWNANQREECSDTVIWYLNATGYFRTDCDGTYACNELCQGGVANTQRESFMDPETCEITYGADIERPTDGPPYYYYWVSQLSYEFTDEMLYDLLKADINGVDWYAFSGGTPYGYLNFGYTSNGEPEVIATVCKYKVKHPVPKVRTGKCYRVEWVERFCPAVKPDGSGGWTGGFNVNSVEVINGGDYRPIFYVGSYWDDVAEEVVGSDGGGGYGLEFSVFMNSSGGVDYIKVTNGGSGYTEAPTLRFEGTDPCEAHCVIDTNPSSPTFGKVTSIVVDSSGDYMPELLFEDVYATGAVRATGTINGMDKFGRITGVTVTNAGSLYGYGAGTGIGLYAYGDGVRGWATFFVHCGEEEEKCYKWDGVIPEGYDQYDADTWPESEEFEFDFLDIEDEGIKTTQIKKVYCDCSNCDE